MGHPLEGIRVIELTRNVAGPYAGRLLAEFGAEVVKLEPPRGDPSRSFGPFPNDVPHPERSGLFLHLNRNKQSVVVDPSTAEGAATIRMLAANADILLEDYEAGAAERWGWGYDALSALNPRLVVTSITPFGQSGPYRDYRGSELTLQAIGGPLHANGHADREPLKLGGHFACYHAGIAAATATLMALRRAAASGDGDWLDVSLYECQSACRDRRTNHLTVASYTGMSCGRRATSAPRTLAYGVRRARDGLVDIYALGRVRQLLEMLGEHDAARRVAADATALDGEELARLDAAYDRWLASRSKAEALQAAQQNGLLAGAVNTIADVVVDPYFRRRGVWDEIEHPEVGTLRYPGRPFRMFAAERVAGVRAPLLDEHGSAWRRRQVRDVAPASTAPTARQGRVLPLPLDGVRVAEITVVWAGPHVTQLLAEWGADVIRVEPVNRVQPFTRGMENVPTREQARELVPIGLVGYPDNEPGNDPWNRAASFNSHARNKRSMTADIMSPEGREGMLRLVRHCDVLVENNVPETIDKAGLDWDTLHAANPRLIMLRMPAFGLDGPYRNYRAFGAHVEAMVGHTLLRGYPDAGPEALSPSLAADGISGVQGALAVLLALRHRESTGEGQLIELTLAEGFLPLLGEFVLDHAMNGRDTPSQGNAHRVHAPHNVYPCRGDDQWIAIDVATDAEFANLCRVLDHDALAFDDRFATVAARRAYTDELDAALAAATRDHDKQTLFHALQAAGVCAAPTHDPLEALADPHLAARGFFEPLPTGDDGVAYRYPGLMWRMHRTPNRLRTPPARLGEHNRAVYCELLGYSEEEFAALAQRGLVGTRFPESIWRPRVDKS